MVDSGIVRVKKKIKDLWLNRSCFRQCLSGLEDYNTGLALQGFDIPLVVRNYQNQEVNALFLTMEPRSISG